VAKDTIEGVRLQAVENINKYQAETIKWRDRKSPAEKYQARAFGASESG
jgi:ribosomal protein L7/L12